MDETKHQVTLPPTKLSFIDLFRQSQLGYDMLVIKGAELAKVPRSVVNAMIVGNPVAPDDAQAVLAILSQHTGKAWSLDTVDVSVLSTTSETKVQHG